MSRARFTPTVAWLRETMILAERYRENRGVFAKGGEFYEEIVKPGKLYVWTSAEHRAKQLGLVVLKEAA